MNDRTRLILGILFYVAVYFLALLAVPSIGFVDRLVEATPWASSGTVTQITLLLVSLALIFVLSGGDVAGYGLRRTSLRAMLRPIGLALGASVVLLVLGGVILTVAGAGGGGGDVPAASGGFLRFLVGVVLLASTSEEIFARGLVQGFLAPLKERGFTFLRVRISLPVTVSALLFGLGHLALLSFMDPPKVALVVVSTVALGFIAGYYREKTGSLAPAIAVHMVFNLVGWCLMFLSARAMAGH